MIISKVATVFFCFALASSSCWAAAGALEIQEKAEQPYHDSEWLFDAQRQLFLHKEDKTYTKQPQTLIIEWASEGYIMRLAWGLEKMSLGPVCGRYALASAIAGAFWYPKQHAACVKLLLQQGADPNADYSRHFPDSAPALSHAVKYGLVEIVTALLEGGADITLLDDNKLSVFSYLNKIEYCLTKFQNLMTEQEAGVVKEKIKKILLRHCAHLLFRAIDYGNRGEFNRLYLFLWNDCCTPLPEVVLLQNDQGVTVEKYGLCAGFLREINI